MTDDRRPLTSRDTGWARALARRAADAGITPNAISTASMAAAAFAAGSFALSAGADGGARVALLLLAALGCQLRLLCNLIDGMVAIEGGRATPDGALWNELPDRVSDLLILVGAGVACGVPALGWAAAALAVLTAYVRELGHRLTGEVEFGGWMAKPQRMALITAAALVTTLEPLWNGAGGVLLASLAIVAVGSAWTAAARAFKVLARLHA